MNRKVIAEIIGTAWLVLGGCGAAVLAGKGIGLVGISLAFGLSVVTMAYAIGPISGCHLNPAVTIGLAASGRFAWRDVPAYIAAQLIGALAGAAVLCLLAGGVSGSFAANGTGSLSPEHYPLVAGFVVEVVMTFFFLFVILGVTRKEAPAGFAPLAIGLALTLVHLVSIPLTNTSVNPARSTSQAVFAGADYMGQLWIFWLAPIAGAVIAGVLSRWLFAAEPTVVSATPSIGLRRNS